MKKGPLSTTEVDEVKKALVDARAGRATLHQLASAISVVERACTAKVDLNGTLGELREHARRLVPAPGGRNEAVSVLLGIFSGILTHYTLREIERRQ